jgi:thiosulfate dehydrogenase
MSKMKGAVLATVAATGVAFGAVKILPKHPLSPSVAAAAESTTVAGNRSEPGAASSQSVPPPAQHQPATNVVEVPWAVSDVDKLPDDAWGRTVRYGRELITRTYALIGPDVGDPSHRYAGNNLSCQNCHLEAGTKQFGLPFQGVYADFPNYRTRSGAVGTIEDRIQGCMTRSMNGKPLAPEGPEMTAIVAYMKFLSDGRPVGAPTPGRGAGKMPEMTRAADPGHGKQVYNQVCAACHGADGQGQRNGKPGDAQGYLFPPLWGDDSFNDGAGMDRLIAAANFVHTNMPIGTTWRAPVLSPEDAWDIAAFIQAQPRPHKANLDRDYPVRTEKPVDAGYGPYADDFSIEQHKLGPFGPVRERLQQRMKQAAPDKPQSPGG